MVRARVSPYCLVVMALVACCLSTAPGQERKTWLESLQHCKQQGRQLATPSNGGFNASGPGIFWVGAIMSLTEWVWGERDPLYRYQGCRLEAEGTDHDLGLANEAGACFHLCPGKRFVALKGTKCHCLDNEGRGDSDTCKEMCYRNANNTCGGQNAYSVYNLNLLEKEPSQTIVMTWSSDHKIAATFESPNDSLWKIVPTQTSGRYYMYCYRTDFKKISFQRESKGYQEGICNRTDHADVLFTSGSSIMVQIYNRNPYQNHYVKGWIYLSRIHLPRWIDGKRTDGFPEVNEAEPEPLCGTLSWDGARQNFNWMKCNVSLPFLCSPAAPDLAGRPDQSDQSEARGLDTIYVAIAGAGGAVVLVAVLVSICLCRKRTSRVRNGNKTGRQLAIQQGHVTFGADVTGGPGEGNYRVKTPDGVASAEYMNVPACSSTKKIELVEDEFEGNYACVDDPPKASAFPVKKEVPACSSTKKVELVEDEIEGNYACVDDPPKATPLPVQKEAASAPSPSPASAAAEADSCMYAVVQKPTNQNASAQQNTGPGKATPPLDKQEVKPLEELYACVKK